MVLYDLNPNAKIGKDVTISNFTTIYDDVVIGDGTWIGPNVTIFPGARIGRNCKIFPGSVISAIPQDLKFNGEYTTCEIGDNNVIRECCTINRGTAASGRTVVGNDNLLMAYVHVAHDCIIGNHCVLANNATLLDILSLAIGPYWAARPPSFSLSTSVRTSSLWAAHWSTKTYRLLFVWHAILFAMPESTPSVSIVADSAENPSTTSNASTVFSSSRVTPSALLSN